MDISEKIYISEYPLYDIVLHTSSSHADFEYEMEKCEKVCLEEYELDLSDPSELPDWPEDSRFLQGMKLVHFAMIHAYD